jgi:RimJ/RimL family protein N-acetyltransferase
MEMNISVLSGSATMSNWQQIKDQYLDGVSLSKDNRVVEVVNFKDYGNTYVVYGWEDKRYKGAKGYQGQDLAKEMALEWLNGNDEVLEWDN